MTAIYKNSQALRLGLAGWAKNDADLTRIVMGALVEGVSPLDIAREIGVSIGFVDETIADFRSVVEAAWAEEGMDRTDLFL